MFAELEILTKILAAVPRALPATRRTVPIRRQAPISGIFPRACTARMFTAESPWRAASPICYANVHHSSEDEETSKYLPAGPTPHMLNNFIKSPSRITSLRTTFSAPLRRLVADKIAGHQSVHGREVGSSL